MAGRFYPSDAGELRRTVDRMLAEARPATKATTPAAVIAPHAGYRYSGPIAASAYARLGSGARAVRRVVVLGPAHFVPVPTIAVPAAAAFATPLGTVPVDTGMCGRIVDLGLARRTDEPHAPEHSIEVQIPFLQRTLGSRWELVPIVVGAAGERAVADVLDVLFSAGTLVVCSTDLSHYLPREQARARDRRTAEAIVTCDIEAIGPRDACGAPALRGLLGWARDHEPVVDRLDLRTSADTVGEPSRVVGYGAFTVTRSVVSAGSRTTP
ncbi:MAG TPA: AmmeMemoRadiSam system protein B [Mycobacterium sp.]